MTRSDLPHNLYTHKHSWRAMLVRCAERAACAGDEDDRDYFNHEIKAFDETWTELELIPND